MRRHPVRQIEIDLIDIAPPPAFGRIIAFDDRVRCRMEMLGRMAIWRVVAAADMPARPAQPKMHPPGSRLQTFLATVRTGRDVRDRMIMRAGIGHARSLAQARSWSTGYSSVLRKKE